MRHLLSAIYTSFLFLLLLTITGCASFGERDSAEVVPNGLSTKYKSWEQADVKECTSEKITYRMTARDNVNTAVLTFKPVSEVQPLVHFVQNVDSGGAEKIDLHGYFDGHWTTVPDIAEHPRWSGYVFSKALRDYHGNSTILAYAKCLMYTEAQLLQESTGSRL